MDMEEFFNTKYNGWFEQSYQISQHAYGQNMLEEDEGCLTEFTTKD